MKFHIIVAKEVIKVIFNNKTKINILLYFIILELELTIHLNMIIIM